MQYIYAICNTYKASEATTGDVLYKMVFLKISQYSQENTYVRVYVCMYVKFI